VFLNLGKEMEVCIYRHTPATLLRDQLDLYIYIYKYIYIITYNLYFSVAIFGIFYRIN